MIDDIIQAIADKLAALYPGYEIYVDDAPEDFAVPSFLITLAAHGYSKRIYGNSSTATFDIAYFSGKGVREIKGDCRTVQENLLREIDMAGSFRAINKTARVTDNVLHVSLDVRYCEISFPEETSMQKQQTNTNL